MIPAKKLEGWGASAPRILVVGFCGHSTDVPFGRVMYSQGGQILRKAFKAAGINWSEVRFETILPFAAPLDQAESLLCGARDIPAALKPYARIGTKFLKPEYFEYLAAFQAKLAQLKPTLVVTLGSEACSLLTGEKSLTEVRGTVLPCSFDSSYKVLPIYHPSMIFKQASAEVIFNADLRKVQRESGFAGIVRTRREITIPECVEDCREWWRDNVTRGQKVTVDIETVPSYRVITCIGFAASPTKALTIPLYCKAKAGGHYWSPSEEVFILRFLKAALEHSSCKLNMQGGAYDVQWIYEQLGIRCYNYEHDTMLLHHSLYPEMKKGLAFLASIYTNEPSWKGMVKFSNKPGEKSDG